MVSGHSYLPNDRDFSSIEGAKRKTQVVYLPSEWYNLVRTCRRNNPFEVLEMESEDFKSFNMVKSAIVNRKKTIDKEKVDWLQMRWIRFERSHPFWVQYCFSHNELLEFVPPIHRDFYKKL